MVQNCFTFVCFSPIFLSLSGVQGADTAHHVFSSQMERLCRRVLVVVGSEP